MANAKLTLTPELSEQIGNELRQIGSDMLAIKALVNAQAANGTMDHLDEAINVLAMRSGAIADGVLAQISQTQCVGAVSEWFNVAYLLCKLDRVD